MSQHLSYVLGWVDAPIGIQRRVSEIRIASNISKESSNFFAPTPSIGLANRLTALQCRFVVSKCLTLTRLIGSFGLLPVFHNLNI